MAGQLAGPPVAGPIERLVGLPVAGLIDRLVGLPVAAGMPVVVDRQPGLPSVGAAESLLADRLPAVESLVVDQTAADSAAETLAVGPVVAGALVVDSRFDNLAEHSSAADSIAELEQYAEPVHARKASDLPDRPTDLPGTDVSNNPRRAPTRLQ